MKTMAPRSLWWLLLVSSLPGPGCSHILKVLPWGRADGLADRGSEATPPIQGRGQGTAFLKALSCSVFQLKTHTRSASSVFTNSTTHPLLCQYIPHTHTHRKMLDKM